MNRHASAAIWHLFELLMKSGRKMLGFCADLFSAAYDANVDVSERVQSYLVLTAGLVVCCYGYRIYLRKRKYSRKYINQQSIVFAVCYVLTLITLFFTLGWK